MAPVNARAVSWCAAAAAVLAAGAAGAAAPPSRYELPGRNSYPEGIAVHGDDYFVGATNGGAIFRGRLLEPRAHVFLPGGRHGRTVAVGMKVGTERRLFVAGGPTGRVFVYSTVSRALLAALRTPGSGGFLNDVAIGPNGDAFVTDSFRPKLYRVPASTTSIEEWLDFGGTPFLYEGGFNANGIVVTPDRRHLLIVQSNTGRLFRITISTKRVREVRLAGGALHGDGMLLRGRTLWAVADGAIVKVSLAADYLSGRIVSRTSHPSFRSPTTIAFGRGRLLVVNSQFDARTSGKPELPFTVSSVLVP